MKMKELFKPLAFSLAMLLCGMCVSCTDDEAITKEAVSDSYLVVAQSVLQDSIVLNATAMQGTVNKTCLDEGCPLKYYFKWKGQDTLNVQIRNFSVGKMPVNIDFSINVTFMKLNTWEQDEYGSESSGWIKFKGYNGITDYMGNSNSDDFENGTGGSGTVVGYFSANTREIEFVTNFNVMNFTADVYRQVIDTTRMSHYEEDFAQYEEDLAKYKEEHGL
jgi:hypothetical protein